MQMKYKKIRHEIEKTKRKRKITTTKNKQKRKKNNNEKRKRKKKDKDKESSIYNCSITVHPFEIDEEYQKGEEEKW